MVVRPDALRERIATLREAIARLQHLRDEPVRGPVEQWALERGLQVAAQALFDIGNHVLAGGFGLRAADYAAIAPLLAERGVIEPTLESRLRGLAGFRNLLVHDYVRINAAQVRLMLVERLPDLEAFADAVEAWLEAQEA